MRVKITDALALAKLFPAAEVDWALGQQAVEQGLRVAWFTLEDLGVLLRRHRADDTVARAITRVLRADLVVVDDIGLLPVAADAAEGPTA